MVYLIETVLTTSDEVKFGILKVCKSFLVLVCVKAVETVDLGDAIADDSFVICVESKIWLADLVLEAKDVFIVAFDVVSITIGCIVIIWTVVIGIFGDRVFSVVETSVDVALENSVESNEVSVDSILVVKMSPDVELFEMSVVVDDDVNDGVYCVVEDAIGDWLPEFDCVFMNVVEADITLALVVIVKVL